LGRFMAVDYTNGRSGEAGRPDDRQGPPDERQIGYAHYDNPAHGNGLRSAPSELARGRPV
jgi:hypothetical protein